MGILLGFAPFIIFALLTGLSVDLALWAALSAAFVVAIRDFAQTRILRSLDVGSVVLFAALALYAGFIQPGISVQAVRLAVDGGLLLLVCAAMLSGDPFANIPAKGSARQDFDGARRFVRGNYIVAGVWALAFAVMTVADAAATFNRTFPLTLDVAAGLAALTAAVVFTARFPTSFPARVRFTDLRDRS
jgi:hypothetical protein